MSIPIRIDYMTHDDEIYANICLFTISYGSNVNEASIRKRISDLIKSYKELPETHKCKDRDKWLLSVKKFKISSDDNWCDI